MDTTAIWTFKPYTPALQKEWDAFVQASANATFMLQRGYMDYHSHRFNDASLLAYKHGKLAAILPANITADGCLHSHQGLTYGGWILPMRHVDGADVPVLIDSWIKYCHAAGITAIDYRPVPAIYHRLPVKADIYSLWRAGATMAACGLSSTIDLALSPGLNTLQRRHLRKALASGDISIVESSDTRSFIRMLAACLMERHNVSPVHTAEELELLRSRFPENIRFFFCCEHSTPQAAVCIFDTPMCAHAQYIATTPRGRELNMLTPLFHNLISSIFASRRYFDFGISTEDDGRYLNAGLIRQKSSFGAGTTIYPRLSLTL